MEKRKQTITAIKVYLNTDKTSFKICRPKIGEKGDNFEGGWNSLAHAMSGHRTPHGYDLM